MITEEHAGYLEMGLNPMNVIRLEGHLGKVWEHTSKGGKTKQMGNLSVYGMEGQKGFSPLVYVHGWQEAGEQLIAYNGQSVVVWGTLRGWRRSDGTMAYDVLVKLVEPSTFQSADDFRTDPFVRAASLDNGNVMRRGTGGVPGEGDLEL